MDGENLRLILGLKLRQFRLKKGYALKDVAERTGLSVSFLSEIEKGKKYPKPEKIMQLAQALDVTFDDLVSLKLDEDLDPVARILDSPFLKEFPFHLFGIEPRSVLDLMAVSPNKAAAFIRTFLEIAQSYDMGVEHFLLAALRSYQIMHHNYFPDLESAAVEFVKRYRLGKEPPADLERLRSILTDEYGYVVEETTFADAPDLRGFRSVWIDGRPPRLLINANLLPMQKAFIIGREIGFNYLRLQERAATSSWIKVESFEQVLNNFKASYFAGAVLINQEFLYRDLNKFFQNRRWRGEALLAIMRRYRATPEMFLYRLSQLIPKLFELNEIYYLRFNNVAGTDTYRLTKELNMSRVGEPHGLGLNEHHCQRWLSISALRTLAERQKNGHAEDTFVAAQKSNFVDADATFFTITLARPLVLSEGTNSSISMGFLMDEAFKERVRFWDDPEIPTVEVNVTCERCGLSESVCGDRAAPPLIYEQQELQRRREEAVKAFMEQASLKSTPKRKRNLKTVGADEVS